MRWPVIAALLLGCLVVMPAAAPQEGPPAIERSPAFAGAGPQRMAGPQGPPAGFRPKQRRWRGEGPDAGTRELLEQVMIARLSQELALDDEQTVLLVRRYANFREQMRELTKQRNELLRDLKAAVKEATDTGAIEAKLDTVIAHDQKILEAKRDLYELAGTDLTAWQRAKLYLFMLEFEADVRQLLMQARERHGRFEEGGPARGEDFGPEGPPFRRKQGPIGPGRQGRREGAEIAGEVPKAPPAP